MHECEGKHCIIFLCSSDQDDVLKMQDGVRKPRSTQLSQTADPSPPRREHGPVAKKGYTFLLIFLHCR